jgi:hypothetical protein
MGTLAKAQVQPRAKIVSMRKRGRRKPQPINIFVSYASEDKELVTSIVNLLRDAFRFAPLVIQRDVEIKQGQNWARAIDTALDEADILLVIFTERMKLSHSYTGYELGYFNRSVQQRAKGGAGFPRIFIPFCIGADIPESMHYIQGVSIGADDVYKVVRTRIDSGTEPTVGDEHPVFKLLSRISDLVVSVLNLPQPPQLSTPASALYRIIHEYLQSRVSSETYPERKLILRTATRPEIGKDGVDLSNACVELVGDFMDVFGIPPAQSVGREYGWEVLCDRMPMELRSNCVAGIRQLTATVLRGGGDNYHVVTSAARDKAFRLFVSKVVTFVSQKTEIHIYVVQMRSKEYGDPLTTRLLKAISVGLRFRFLLLEEQSEFRPEKLGYPVVTAAELKAKVTEMQGQMDLILRDAVEADLRDPALLISIYGPGQEVHVQEMMDVWERSRKRLYEAMDTILKSADDNGFKGKKQQFIEALAAFCREVEQMNCEYTSRVLALLREHVEHKISLPPAAPGPDSAMAGTAAAA